jgi:tetratricopeptide (TPR) repeat protein
LAISTNHNLILNGAAYALISFSNDYSKAELAHKLQEIIPENIYSMATKALVLDKLGSHEEALEWYDKVLAKEPTYIIPLNNKGVALSNLEHYQQALDWYDKALEQIPGNLDIISTKG